MAEYIEKQAALDAILGESPDAHYPSWYAERIKALPADDVAPVVHGKWICKWDSDLGTTTIICSRCRCDRMVNGCFVGVNGEPIWNEEDYCPYCGARMDGGAE